MEKEIRGSEGKVLVLVYHFSKYPVSSILELDSKSYLIEFKSISSQ